MLVFILIFGAAGPSLTPLVLGAFTRGSLNIVVPVQTWLGPPAFLLYCWMRRHYGRERTTAEFLRSRDVASTRASVLASRPAAVTV